MADIGKKNKAFGTIFLVASLTVIFILFCGFCALIALLSHYSRGMPDVGKLAQFEPSESSQIFSSDGSLIGILYKENRIWVPIADIPQNMQDAIIAIEDSRFYHHRGVDPRGIVRAIYQNLRGHGISQGASTITMQLTRNIFLNQERSFKRKIQEMILATQIEKKYTKKEILELYLNQIYFGASAYGIEAAAQTYFGKHAKNLTLPECAMIAGLPAAPSAYSPSVDENAALERQKLVLHRMVECHFISPEQEREALQVKLKYAPRKSEFQLLKYPYFTTYVMKELSKKYSIDYLYRGGLKIYTTIDLRMQNAASTALQEGINTALEKNMNATNGAIVAIDPSNGFIKVMVGGLKYTQKNQFNRAWQARRQPGSAFKVFIFTAAIDNGYSPDSLIDDSPITYTTGGGMPWTPKNSDSSYLGTLTFRDSLKWSRNVCAVKLLDKIGVDRVIEYAQKMGIEEPLEHNLTIALGSSVVTPLEMASAFGVLANGGIRCKPTSIKLIVDSKGNIIEDHRTPKQKEVLSESTALTMTDMLQDVIKSGTGTAAQIGRPAAGKTGTTDESKDAWFVGFVPQLSCAVWIGNDDSSAMNNVYGGVIAAPIWAKFMKAALAKEKIRDFSSDIKGMIGIPLCQETGMRATGTCPVTLKEYFTAGNIPRRYCTKHGPRIFSKKETKAIHQSPLPAKAPSSYAASPEEMAPTPEASYTAPPTSESTHAANIPPAPKTAKTVTKNNRKNDKKVKQTKQLAPEEPNTVAPTIVPGLDDNTSTSEGPVFQIEGPPSPIDTQKEIIDIAPPPVGPDEGPEPVDTKKSQEL